MNPAHHFELLRTHPIAALNLVVEEYRHKGTGAQHIHLASDQQENVFLVALRTVPHDSKGVAHILEHTALCGSARYPVRDPFFMMTRRSLNTFMNAFTSSDWTAYPFASLNTKDYFNLLDVYLDAVFFPNLNKLDFAQEGHRLEFSEPENPQSELTIKGIVYNEMKGALSSPTSRLWHQLCEHLFPTTTYHYNSGGDPESIPQLSYKELQDFHRTHYHPSNAIFMTFGDIAAADIQMRLQNTVLNQFESLNQRIEVGLEHRYAEPKYVETKYPVGADEPTQNRAHVVLGWLLGDSTDLYTVMEAQLLSSVLLDHSASPLMQALETSNLGRAPSPLCGLDDSQREMCFVCGLEGCDSQNSAAVEQLIIETISSVATNGVPMEEVESCLHQLELHQREISGDGMPYGLHLIMSALNSATHRGDPATVLDLEPVLDQLREAIKDPAFIKRLAQRLLLENNHRVRLTMSPDPEFQTRQSAREKSRLDKIQSSLTEADCIEIIEQAKALQDRQNQQDNPEILPKVSLADVPKELPYPEKRSVDTSTFPLINYSTGTNGIVYQHIITELPKLEDNETGLLPLLTYLMTEVGQNQTSYLDVQKWQSRVSGGINASYLVRGTPFDNQDTRGYFNLSGKALNRNHNALAELLQSTLFQCRFDEHKRIRELIAQARLRSENSITGNGHALAMSAAAQNMAPVARLTHQTSGLAGISFIKDLDDRLDQSRELDELLQRLAELHGKLLNQPVIQLVIGEEELLDTVNNSLSGLWKTPPSQAGTEIFSLPRLHPASANQMWIANTQINFCARAYATVPSAHPDAAPLSVLAGFLRNNYLHRTIREQGGAYGGGASQDNNSGVFRFFSYRDPRLAETLTDFEKSLIWLQNENHDDRLLEEAVLGVISQIDKPSSPAGEARQAFVGELFGRSRQTRDQFRQRVLDVSLHDLKVVADRYLQPESSSTALLTNESSISKAESLGLDVVRL